MTIDEYFSQVSMEMQQQSNRIRESFKSHRPTAGTNREALIAKFMEKHLPKSFGVGSGLVMSAEGIFSNQADIVIYDQLLNSPLHADLPENLFTVESVYGLVEAKTNLTPSELSDSISKCRRFKGLERQFLPGPSVPKIKDSLFIIFAFKAAKPKKVKETLLEVISDVPVAERPDFIVVPGSFVVHAGQYFELAKIGQPESSHRKSIERKDTAALEALKGEGLAFYDLGDDSLMMFFIWLTSWLQYAGSRTVPLFSYLPDRTWGRLV